MKKLHILTGTVNMINNQLTNVEQLGNNQKADLLGFIKAIAANVSEVEKALKTNLTETGLTAITGLYWKVSISHSSVKSTNWKIIAAKLHASRQIITANTKEAERVTVRVNAIPQAK